MPKKRKPVPRRKPRKPVTTAIVTVPAPTIIQHNRERRLRPEEVDLLKKTVAKGTTDDEFLYFMTVCRKHRIDPFTKQIYCVVWPTNNGASHEVVIIMGIGGYRMTAARDHKDFGGTSKATFTYQDTKLMTPAGRRIPETACVKALRKGGEPAEAEVFWEEFAPTDLRAKRSDFWNRMPKHMLAKCAEALAIRKAFPDLSDIYTEEEVSARLADLTEGGREIVVDGVNPSGRVADTQYGSRQASQRVLSEKLAGRSDTPPIDVKASQGRPVREQPKRHATLDWTNPQSPILTGDIADLVPKSKPPYGLLKGLNVVWGADEFFHVGLDAVADLRAICKESGYELTELHPKSTASKSSVPKKEAPVAAKPSSGVSAKPGAKQESTGPTTVSGTIERVTPDVKYSVITLVTKDGKHPTWKCFSKTVSDILHKNLGKAAQVIIETRESKGMTYTNLVGLKVCAGIEYDEDGRTPIIQNSTREAGGKTLFG
jgi:phage recombination protein Bet